MTEAVVELAEASGLRRVDIKTLDALHATSRGTGELIRIALDAVRDGSWSESAAAPAPTAAPACSRRSAVASPTRAENEIGPGGVGLEDVEAIDLSGGAPRAGALLDRGCLRHPKPAARAAGRRANVRAPEGRAAEDVIRLERALTHFAAIAARSDGGDVSAHSRSRRGGRMRIRARPCRRSSGARGRRRLRPGRPRCRPAQRRPSSSPVRDAWTGRRRPARRPPRSPPEPGLCGIPCIAIAGHGCRSAAAALQRRDLARQHRSRRRPDASRRGHCCAAPRDARSRTCARASARSGRI